MLFFCDDFKEIKTSVAKKCKIDDEGRALHSEWCPKYLVVPHNQGVVCLVCQNTIALMKEYDVKRHYTSKHSSQFDEILGQAWVDKIEHLKNVIKNSNVFLPVACRIQN